MENNRLNHDRSVFINALNIVEEYITGGKASNDCVENFTIKAVVDTIGPMLTIAGCESEFLFENIELPLHRFYALTIPVDVNNWDYKKAVSLVNQEFNQA